MEFTVIGHLSKDRIIAEGATTPTAVQFGGLFYTIAALSALSGPNDKVRPVCSVGMSDLDEVRELLQGYPNVDADGIFPVVGPTNEVTFIYGGADAPKTECSEHIADPIPLARIKPYLDASVILVNMVSGSDITLETLDHMRMAVRDARTPIHFDFHSLTLGTDRDQKRFRRPLTDWRRWCFMLSTVQMSEEEAAGLTAERYDEATLVNQLMPLMVQTLLITRGARGVSLVTQDIHKHLTRTDLPGMEVSARDTTGCGDVFGAAFVRAQMHGHDAVASAAMANEIASVHSSLPAAGKLAAITERLRARAAA